MKRVLTFSLIIYLLAAGTDLETATGANTGIRYMRASSDTIPAGDAQPCPGTPTVTDIDGNVYNTVKIGEQCWMKENLRVTHYADGTDIPTGGSTISTTDPYNYIIPNLDAVTYGYFYNWLAAMHGAASSNSNPSNVQGVCPNGWHLPSNAEWTQLTNYVGNQSEYQCGGSSDNIAKALASTEGWNNSGYDCAIGNNQTANNATGFSAFPAGRYDGSSSTSVGYNAIFWSTSQDESGPNFAYGRNLSNIGTGVYQYSPYKGYGHPVRCLRGAELSMPTVSTDTASGIGTTTATGGGNVTSDGGATVTARGVCWNTIGAPTLADAHTSDGTGAGEFTSSITGLEPNTTYYVRAYATSSVGTAYGNEVSFTTLAIPPGDALPCPGHETVTDYDGNVYNTVKIGEQCWMKENLRTTHYADGEEIPDGTDAGYNYYISVPYRYNPGNNIGNVPAYGHLYNWTAAMHGVVPAPNDTINVQGACPTGWHLPSANEWTQLTDYVSSVPGYWCNGDSNSILKALASTIGWNSVNGECTPGNDLSLNNTTGFSAMPATCFGTWCGPCSGNAWCTLGGGVSVWSSTSANGGYPSAIAVGFNTDQANSPQQNVSYRSHGYSVRCLLGAGCFATTSEFTDTICSGDSYTWNGQTYTEGGDYTQTLTNAAGCDSAVTLHLTVTDCAPSCDAFTVRILGDTAECATDSVTLHAMVPGSVPPVAVGDILCTDNTIVKPGDWPVTGKTALGVVFHVDASGLHGWAVHLNDQSTSNSWGGYGTDIPNLPNFGSSREALADTAGYANTQNIRAYGNESTYPAAWKVDLDNGWYLPAAGQLRVLYGELPTLNASLQIVGGTPFPMSGYRYYWSSTESNSGYAWTLTSNGDLYTYHKSDIDRVRSVRAF